MPLTLQRTAVSGWPLLVITARKFCVAPSSTLAAPGKIVSATSLVTVIAAVADFVGSAWLVAVTCTVAGEGKSAGAVYTPSAVMVPLAAFPPAVPLTLQLTAGSVELLTVAMNSCVFPKRTEPPAGVTVTLTERGGGGGGGATEPAPPPPQPSVHAPVARSTRNGRAFHLAFAKPASL